ncbi:MAG TPA: cobalamin-dependent protein [Acidimicrobiia bacterium]
MSTDETGLPEARLAATAAALGSDSGGLYHLVAGLMGEGVPFETILFDVLVPAEQDIGSRWQSGDYLVSEEHAATATVETVVSLLAGSFDLPKDGARVVIGAVEGDHHSLPARLIAAHLLYLGYRAVSLGANVLASDLGDYLAIEPPDALVLSCAMSSHLLGARASIRAGHSAGVPVIVGGKGFGEGGRWATPLGADSWVATPRDVAEVLGSWSPDPEASEAEAVDPSEELLRLMGHRASVIGAARSELTSAGVDLDDNRLADEISLLLGAVEASLLVADDQVIVDMLRWQETTLSAHGYDGSDRIADALGSALTGVSSMAQAALGRAMGSN